MLVLSRKRGQQIAIADDTIMVTVVEILGDTVRLGIDAPPDVIVNREEVHRAKLRGFSPSRSPGKSGRRAAVSSAEAPQP